MLCLSCLTIGQFSFGTDSTRFDFVKSQYWCQQLDHCQASDSRRSKQLCYLIACHCVAKVADMSKKRFRPLGDVIRMGLIEDGALLRYVVGLLCSAD